MSLPKVVFLNSVEPKCSIHNMGLSLYRILSNSERFEYSYSVAENPVALLELVKTASFSAVIINHHPVVQPWCDSPLIKELHKYTPRVIAFLTHGSTPVENFDVKLIPDPTFPSHENQRAIGRPLPKIISAACSTNESRPIIGTVGFLLPHKNFRLVVEKVCESFERAIVRIAISSSFYCAVSEQDIDQELKVCRDIANQSGKEIDVLEDREYRPPSDRVDWLAINDLNVFFYKPHGGMPATAPDLALAAGRPMSVNKSELVKLYHGLNPSICIEDSNLKTILKNGIEPLLPLRSKWSDSNICREVDEAVSE